VFYGTVSGPPRDLALLNAAATLVVGDRAGSLPQGLQLAAEAIDRGAVAETLERLIDLSN